MTHSIRKLIVTKDYAGLAEALSTNPKLANEEFPLDESTNIKAHPLHRLCDGVFVKAYTDEEAVRMAQIFLENGANVNGNNIPEKHDTPLIAAASLGADQVAILYMENGANIHHSGTHGGSAMHWSAWCGRDKLVERFLQKGVDINRKCIDFKATPIFWAIHGWKQSDRTELLNYLRCVKFLIDAGADKNIPNKDGNTVFDLLDNKDVELKALLN